MWADGDECLKGGRERIDELRQEKMELLGSLKKKLECADEEEVRKKLASNPKFAAKIGRAHV